MGSVSLPAEFWFANLTAGGISYVSCGSPSQTAFFLNRILLWMGISSMRMNPNPSHSSARRFRLTYIRWFGVTARSTCRDLT